MNASHHNMPDIARVRREALRWLVILTLNNARPLGCAEGPILSVAQTQYPDASPIELRREIDYLADRELVNVSKAPHGPWHAELTRHGVDVAEYTVDVQPGIARPARYW